jgi:adenine/guanine phosphoribosyltransferase-like PRPP-binding protein
MNKYTDFPEQPRIMSNAQGEHLFQTMLKQIADYNPDEIIAVHRSGFSYAMWVAQILKLPLGVYFPKKPMLDFDSDNPKKVVFVDDNILSGTTYQATKEFMAKNYPDVEYKWAVLFSDWNATSETIRNEIIQGTRLTYFAEEPIWGSRKVSKEYGVRFRDE